MKAILITPDNHTLSAVDVGGLDDIARLVGYATIESDAVGKDGDRLYFDEECFLRGAIGRFQLDNLIPISGKAVLVGASAEGSALHDVKLDIEALRGRINYL